MISRSKGKEKEMTAVLFDLDGALYDGDVPIKGAPETVEWFQKGSTCFTPYTWNNEEKI